MIEEEAKEGEQQAIMVPLNEIKISSVQMLHEMMTRNLFVLPALKCRWTNLQKLLQVRDGKLWGMKQPQVVYRICTRPPSCRILCEKVDSYLSKLALPASGIDVVREKYPNRDWLVLAVSTLSAGNDEIFHKEYVPAPNERRRNAPQVLQVHNNDGLLDVPEALLDKTKKRSLRMITLSKEDRLKAKLLLL